EGLHHRIRRNLVIARREELARAEVDHVAALGIPADLERSCDRLTLPGGVRRDEKRVAGVGHAPVQMRLAGNVELPQVALEVARVYGLDRARVVRQIGRASCRERVKTLGKVL